MKMPGLNSYLFIICPESVVPPENAYLDRAAPYFSTACLRFLPVGTPEMLVNMITNIHFPYGRF